MAACCRYVDDFFGCDQAEVLVSGGDCATILFKLMGFPSDEIKSCDALLQMVVLGAEVKVDISQGV